MFDFRSDNLTDMYKTNCNSENHRWKNARYPYEDLDLTDHILTDVVGENYHKEKETTMETNFSWKKEFKSFAITFFVGFLLVIYDQLDNFTLEALKSGAVLGIIMGGVRAGLKAIIELFLRIYNK